MAEVAEVLGRYGSDVTEGDIATFLEEQLRVMPVSAAAAPSAGAVAFLAQHGGAAASSAVASWNASQEQRERVGSAAAAGAELVAATMSVKQAAEQLGVDSSRIRHLISDLPLRVWAVKVGSRRRIPAWQLHAGALLPHLKLVVQAIPRTAHPLDLAALMTARQDELDGRTPVEHLLGGGPPEPVADLVRDLGRW